MRRRWLTRWSVASALCVAVPYLATAYADEDLDRPRLQPAHGGQIRAAGPYRLELVADKGNIKVYVTDPRGCPIATAGGKGKAVVHTDGKGVTIPIQPAQPNLLKGKGRFKLKRSSVIFVTVHLRGAKPQKSVFRPLDAMPFEPTAHGRT